jgi:bcr-type benzoyl-CoA reductase subunit C
MKYQEGLSNDAKELLRRIEGEKRRLMRLYERQEDFLVKAKKKGRKVFGYMCSHVPEEILFSADIIPVRILGHLGALGSAEEHFQPFVCRLIRSSLDRALRGELEFLDGVVIPYTCDGMRMLHDTWAENVKSGFVVLLDIPSCLNSDTNIKYFRSAYNEFIRAVENYIGHTIGRQRLRDAIVIYNRYRELVKRFYFLRQNYRLPVGESEALKIYLAGLVSAKDDYSESLGRLVNWLEKWSTVPLKDSAREPVRVHVSGSVVVDPSYFELVEEAGGRVVSDDLCSGTRYFWDLIEESGDPFEALEKRYLLTGGLCPSKYPTTLSRTNFLVDRVRESKADGVILILEKYCDPHLFDFPGLASTLESLSIPSLALESELVASGKEQLRTRIEAFFNVVERRKGYGGGGSS